MYPLFETIAIIDGKARNLIAHERRMRKSYKQYYAQKCPFKLFQILSDAIQIEQGKLKFSYRKDSFYIEQGTYEPRLVERLKVLECEPFDYSLKYTDRSILDALYAQRDSCDEVLIVTDGMIRDTSIANIVLWNGERWETPKEPLLKGTMRHHLIEKGLIEKRDIYLKDLFTSYKGFKLINALQGFEKGKYFSIDRLVLNAS